MTEPNTDGRGLSAEDRAYAAAHLNEIEDDRAARIAEIRDWILGEADLHARTDDFYILRFLRACKFNVEKTKLKLRNYYKHRTTMPEWFGNRNPFLPELQDLFQLGVFLPLRKVDDHGRMVIVIRAAVHDPVKHKQSDVLKAGMMVLDLAIKEHESASVHGVTAILDLQRVTAGHALQMPPHVIKNLVHSWQGCYPLRINSLDFVNAPIYVNVVLKIFKSFMTTKLRRRVHIHTRGMQVFCEQLPSHILPIDYGGTDGTVQELIDYWKGAVENNRGWFAEDEKYRMTLPSNK